MSQLAGRTRQAGRAQVLDGRDAIQLVELQARFAEQFLQKWVANLDGGTALRRSLVHLNRGKGGAVNPITPGVGTDEEDDVTGTVGAGAAQPLVANQTDAHGIDDRIVGVALIEVHVAANRWTAEAVAVAANPGDDPVEQVAAPS